MDRAGASSVERRGGRRTFVIEVMVAIAVIAILPPRVGLIGLVLFATLSNLLRGQSWEDLGLVGEKSAEEFSLGLGLGLALGVGLHALIGPGSHPFLLLRYNTNAFVMALLLALATAFSTEMLARGYVIGRIVELWGESASGVAVACGSLFGIVLIGTTQPVAVLGLGVFGLGMGLFYLAGQKRLAMPIGVQLGIPLVVLIADFVGIA